MIKLMSVMRWEACRTLVAALIMGFCLPPSAIAAEEEAAVKQGTPPVFELGVQDKISLRVGQWKNETGEYVAWTDFGGEYSIGPDGTIGLPIAGRIAAAGRNVSALTEEIAGRIQQQLGLLEPPEVSIEVLEFRPVYVVGAVNRPGAFPYVPDLTVIQAVGLAGGMERTDTIFLRSERNALSALGDYELLRLSLWRALAREARIEAELANADKIPVPERLADIPIAQELLDLESEVKEANDKAEASSVAQIESLKALLTQQIEKLTEQIALRARQVTLAQEELKDVRSLSDRGLTVSTRLNAAERLVADLQAGMLELETAKLRAEQQLNEAERDRLDLVNERRKNLVEQLSETRQRVAEIDARMETAKALFAEATRNGTGLYRPEFAGGASFTITRREGEEIVQIEAERTTPLRPGDVLEIQPPDLEELPTGRLDAADVENTFKPLSE